MEILEKTISIITTVLTILVFYKSILTIIGVLCKKKKFPDTDIRKKYTFVLPARNEEDVLPNLIESILNLDYPKELFDIIVIADNCTDNTAKVAKDAGAIVYERFDDTKKRKGYALQYLFNLLIEEGKLNNSDAYIIVDADNLLRKDFLIEINKGFVENKNIVCAYRSCKNFNTNFISGSYGIHFFRSTVSMHRPRAILGTGTHLAGTGICIGSHLLQNGWNYTKLTEDTELSADLVSKNITIGFVEDAVLYDEQPTNFLIAFRQRVRWAKGRLSVFFTTFPKVFFSIFKGIFKHKSLRSTFTAYDFFFYYFPYGLFTLLLSLVVPIASLVLYFIDNSNGFEILNLLKSFGISLLGTYVSSLLLGFVYVIREHKKINCSVGLIILYTFLWPWFDMVDAYITLYALLKRKVTWKQIPHNDTRKVESLKK